MFVLILKLPGDFFDALFARGEVPDRALGMMISVNGRNLIECKLVTFNEMRNSGKITFHEENFIPKLPADSAHHSILPKSHLHLKNF